MVNYLAVLVFGIINMAIGALWYSPLLFGNMWMKLIGMKKKDLEKAQKQGMGKTYFVAFLAILLTTYVLAMFVNYANATTFIAGLMVGFWLWLGFIATTTLNIVLWQNKPFNLYLLNVGHYLVVFLITGGVLAIWV